MSSVQQEDPQEMKKAAEEAVENSESSLSDPDVDFNDDGNDNSFLTCKSGFKDDGKSGSEV